MRIIFTYLFFLITGPLFAQDSLILSLKPDKIKIGEHAELTLTLKHFGGTLNEDLLWPSFDGDTIMEKVEIVEAGKNKWENPEDNPELFLHSQNWTITSFDSGYYAIRPVTVTYNGDTLHSNPVLLEVHSVTVDTTKNIKQIKDIYETSLSLGDYLRIIGNWIKDNILLIAIVVVITLLIIYFIYRKRKKPVEKTEPVIIVPPHETAMKALIELESKKLWQEGHIKQYYVELSDILREYIEQRFRIQAMEQTTEEIMGQLRLTDISEISKLTLIPVLKLSDLVKFAKENPIGTENEDMMQRAKDFIQSTIPPVNTNKKNV